MPLAFTLGMWQSLDRDMEMITKKHSSYTG
jgi:hypothetical protein